MSQNLSTHFIILSARCGYEDIVIVPEKNFSALNLSDDALFSVHVVPIYKKLTLSL